MYEMLSGQVPFQGSGLAVMDAHMHQEPPPLEDMPVAVRSLVFRCLEKDPARRYQSSADLRVELKGLLEMTGAGREEATVHLLSDHQEQTTHQLGAQASPSSVTGSDTVSRVAGAPPGQGPSPRRGGAGASDERRRRPMLPLVGGAMLSIAAGMIILAFYLFCGGGSPGPSVTPTANVGGPATGSPKDGIVYIDDANGDNILFADPSVGATPSTLASDGQQPNLSPDGTKLVYVRGDTQTSSIHLIDLTTDNDREIVHGDLLRSPIWISDNEFIFQHAIEQGGADVHRLRVPTD